MLCNTCQRRPICLLHQMAASDKQLQAMLQNLKRCELQRLTTNSSLFHPLRRLRGSVRDFSDWLKTLGDKPQ